MPAVQPQGWLWGCALSPALTRPGMGQRQNPIAVLLPRHPAGFRTRSTNKTQTCSTLNPSKLKEAEERVSHTVTAPAPLQLPETTIKHCVEDTSYSSEIKTRRICIFLHGISIAVTPRRSGQAPVCTGGFYNPRRRAARS